MEVRAEQEGQSVLFYNTAEDPEKEYRAIAQAMEHRVQGILLLPVMKSEKRTADLLKQAEETGISVVLMDRDVSKDLLMLCLLITVR